MNVDNKKIQLLGLQKSGTNYLKSLIEHNLFAIGKEVIWKHEYDSYYNKVNKGHFSKVLQKIEQMKKNQHPTILVTKNPYFWIESILRDRIDILDHLSKDKSDNVSNIFKNDYCLGSLAVHNGLRPLNPYPRDHFISSYSNHPIEAEFYTHISVLCKIWTDYHNFWKKNIFYPSIVVRLEDVLNFPFSVLNTISSNFKIEKKNHFKSRESVLVPTEVKRSTYKDLLTTISSRSERLKKQQNPKIHLNILEEMSKNLSNSLLDFYRYEKMHTLNLLKIEEKPIENFKLKYLNLHYNKNYLFL